MIRQRLSSSPALIAALLWLLLAVPAVGAAPAPGPAAAQPPPPAEAPKSRLPAPPPAPGQAPAANAGSSSPSNGRPLPPVAPAPGVPTPQPGGGSRASGSSPVVSAPLVPRFSGRPSPSQGLSGPAKVDRYRELIRRSTEAAGADPVILAALMEVEGSGEGAISPAGAMGLMQLMPDKFRSDDDPYDPATNLLRAAQHIRLLQNRWRTVEQVAAAYFGAIDSQGNVTGASDGNITGHGYVGRFVAAYRRYVESFAKPAPAVRVAPTSAELDLGSLLDLATPRSAAEYPEALLANIRSTFGMARYRMVPLSFP